MADPIDLEPAAPAQPNPPQTPAEQLELFSARIDAAPPVPEWPAVTSDAPVLIPVTVEGSAPVEPVASLAEAAPLLDAAATVAPDAPAEIQQIVHEVSGQKLDVSPLLQPVTPGGFVGTPDEDS